ncbi:MAG TPA: ABC transporter substrate-binding protein [Deltaproteobacteria bacterium]|nr:ABC transporter substrate-binding protein [Deltaproteobacteria bacterium]
MNFQKTICFVLGLFSLFWFTGCEKDTPKGAPAKTVKIGVIYPFSGHSASSGKDLKAAIKLAAEIINQSFDLSIPLAGGKGLSTHGNAVIEIVFKDSQSDEATARQLVEELVHKENVTAVLGCYNSSVTAAASEQAEVLKIPFLNPESTSPILTQRGLKWFFRTTPDDSMFAQNFFAFFSDLNKALSIELPKRLILVYENRLWGTGVARAEKKLAMKHAYQIVEDIPYDSKDKSYEAELENIKAALPGVILQASYADDAVLFMKGYKEKQINPTAILAMNAGFISPSFLEKLGMDGEYIFSREVWALDIGRKKPLVAAVNNLFKERFNRNMNGNSARAFTGLIVLADAINRSKALEPQSIREALLKTHIKSEQLIMPWDGVVFDPETGQNIGGKGIIVQIQKGEYRTVWPRNLSENPIIWPMPSWSERGERG